MSYNEKKFGYVVVDMDNDEWLGTLEEDLLNWSDHLYPVRGKNVTRYKGLCPLKEVEDLRTLLCASPYGAGYRVTVDGVDIFDYKISKRLGKR